MKELYQVTMTLMVMAEDKQDAIYVATGPDIEMSEHDCEVEKAVDVGYPEGWDDAYPWGVDDNRTCKEILKDEQNNLH